ncbi:MAG: hypothetical protein WAV56_02020 [Microgenomates group bacterium]
MNFGDFFRLKRIGLGFTLRAFCDRYGYDPGNISRMERSILSPTVDEEKLAGYAKSLGIRKETEDWVTFFDLAHLAKGRMPEDIQKSQVANRLLPAFFRTMRNKKIDRSKLEELIKILSS